MRPFKILSIVTLTFLAISTSSCKTADTETSMLSSSEEQSAIEPLKLTEAEKKIIDENVETLENTNACIKCDLRGAKLIGAWLNNADLAKADLTGANLTGANLIDADLIEAKLTGANLTGANLELASLVEANLTKADLSKARLGWADLTKANLTKADLSKARLWWADLVEANLTGANLTGANLSKATLIGTTLPRDLKNAIFKGAKAGPWNTVRLRGKR